MEKLLRGIRCMKRGSLCRVVDSRMEEFWKAGKESSDCIFSELCFCILTANFNAERTIRIQREIGGGFLTLSEPKLAKELRRLGHRFPNTRARYIVQARRKKSAVMKALRTLGGGELRDFMVRNVKGLGLKEASHFLRNIGYSDYAVIDFHIIDVLAGHGIIRRQKTLTKRRYLEIEGKLRELGERLGLNLAELDLYLWCMETGKVLK